MFEQEFQLDDDVIHLNHAAVAPWPLRSCEAIHRFTEENRRQGSQRYLVWLEVEQKLREQLRWLINAPSAEDIALLKNTSEGLSVVAHGLDWKAGDNIVSTNQEFPSNRIVWESLADRGVGLRAADLDAGDSPEASILALMDENTRLLSVSSVQYGTGLCLDLEQLGRSCRERGVLFCVDAIQGLGALPFDVSTCEADFVVADGHKWMLGPEGLALFYCRAGLREKLTLHQYGWHMVNNPGDFDRSDWSPAASAQRFECGSPNMLAIHALHASLSLFEEAGMEAVSEQLIRRADYLIERLQDRPGYEILSPVERGRYAGIVTFRCRQEDTKSLYERLMKNGVLCAPRGGGLRFSPHCYTPEAVLDRALAMLP